MRANSFKNRIIEILDDEKSLRDLDDDEKVALCALKIREWPANNYHEFITDSKESDELLSALLGYLAAWDRTSAVKEDKRKAFEETLQKTVISYMQKTVEKEIDFYRETTRS